MLVVALLSLYGLSGRTFNPWWLGLVYAVAPIALILAGGSPPMPLSGVEPSISFEQYVDLMRPWVDRIIGHRAHRHDVCLDAEDLRQDALGGKSQSDHGIRM